MTNTLPAAALALVLAGPATADPAVIVGAVARPDGGAWTVSVTLRHDDTGWEDYADGWRVELADGTVLATRKLSHPHVVEQPFTRSKRQVEVPEGTREVLIRAHTLTDGWGQETMRLSLPDR